MLGKILVLNNEYRLKYSTIYGRDKIIPIISTSLNLASGDLAEFEIVDEFSHPDLFRNVGLFEGMPSARIIKIHVQDELIMQ